MAKGAGVEARVPLAWCRQGLATCVRFPRVSLHVLYCIAKNVENRDCQARSWNSRHPNNYASLGRSDLRAFQRMDWVAFLGKNDSPKWVMRIARISRLVYMRILDGLNECFQKPFDWWTTNSVAPRTSTRTPCITPKSLLCLPFNDLILFAFCCSREHFRFSFPI